MFEDLTFLQSVNPQLAEQIRQAMQGYSQPAQIPRTGTFGGFTNSSGGMQPMGRYSMMAQRLPQQTPSKFLNPGGFTQPPRGLFPLPGASPGTSPSTPPSGPATMAPGVFGANAQMDAYNAMRGVLR